MEEKESYNIATPQRTQFAFLCVMVFATVAIIESCGGRGLARRPISYLDDFRCAGCEPATRTFLVCGARGGSTQAASRRRRFGFHR